MRFPPQWEMRPFSPAAPRKQSQVPSRNAKGGSTPFMQLKRFPETPITMQEEPLVSHHNSRRGPCSPPHLEMRANSPASTREDSQLSPCTSRGGLSHLLKLERNPTVPAQVERTARSLSTCDKASFPYTDSNGAPSIPSQYKGMSDSPVAPLEKFQVPWLNWTGDLTPLLQLKRRAEFHASTGDEA